MSKESSPLLTKGSKKRKKKNKTKEKTKPKKSCPKVEQTSTKRSRWLVSLSKNSLLLLLIIILTIIFFAGPAKHITLPKLPTKKRPPIAGFNDNFEQMLQPEEEEITLPPKLPSLSDEDEEIIKNHQVSFKLPNPGFILHNKLPKSGSTTMHNILTVLSQWNNFEHIKIDSAMMKFDDETNLVGYLNSILRTPMTVLKHHYWLNFTDYGMEAPTWINVMREPISWFESRYWFKQNGWVHKVGARLHDNHSEDERVDIGTCIRRKMKDCTQVIWKYTRFFCGNQPACEAHTEEAKRQAAEISKKRILKDYFIVGILEQFEDSLNLFEKVLPSYFRGAREAADSDFAKIAMNTTRTKDKKKMSQESRDYLQNGPLKYEMDLYIFARALFNKKLLAAGLEPQNPTLWDAQHPESSGSIRKQTLQDEAVGELSSVGVSQEHDHVLHPDKPFRRKKRHSRHRTST